MYRLASLVLVGMLALVGIAGCANARPTARPAGSSQTVSPPMSPVLAPPESMYATSVVLARDPSLDATLKMQRLQPGKSEQSRFYSELTITFDSRNTYWDPNGYILAAITPTGHVDLDHGMPGVGKTAPLMHNPQGGMMWGAMPSDATAIRLIVYAGPTKKSAHRGKQFVVPISDVPVVRELLRPQPDLGIRRSD
jgi:hypothetical protein